MSSSSTQVAIWYSPTGESCLFKYKHSQEGQPIKHWQSLTHTSVICLLELSYELPSVASDAQQESSEGKTNLPGAAVLISCTHGASRRQEATMGDEKRKDLKIYWEKVEMCKAFCLWVSFLLANRNFILLMVQNAWPEFFPIIQQLQRERH